MTLQITHTTIATFPDEPGVEINRDNWNDFHAITGTLAQSQNNVAVDGVTITGDGTPGNPLVSVGSGTIDGTLTANEIVYGVDSNTVGSLAVATYPSLTEIAFVKGVTSSIQTQIGAKFTLPSLTSGSVLFSNGTTIAQDNANLFWDDTNNRLGIGTSSPSTELHLVGNGGQAARFQNSASAVANTLLQFVGNDGLVDAAITYNNTVSQALTFETGAGGATTRMTILDGGNIGIGTTGPSALLHLLGQPSSSASAMTHLITIKPQ